MTSFIIPLHSRFVRLCKGLTQQKTTIFSLLIQIQSMWTLYNYLFYGTTNWILCIYFTCQLPSNWNIVFKYRGFTQLLAIVKAFFLVFYRLRTAHTIHPGTTTTPVTNRVWTNKLNTAEQPIKSLTTINRPWNERPDRLLEAPSMSNETCNEKSILFRQRGHGNRDMSYNCANYMS